MQPQSNLKAEHSFSRVPRAEISRSKFDRSHSLSTAFDGGLLVPVFWDFAFPGDTFAMRPGVVARFATLLRPLMDRVMIDIHWWAIPFRLLQLNWPKLMGERLSPGDSIAYTVAQIDTTDAAVTVASLFDYLDVPVVPTPADYLGVGAYPARAYNQVYNLCYRDQNLINAIPQHVDDGPDPMASYTVQKRGKRLDLYTGILGSPQKGNAVTFSLTGYLPVELTPLASPAIFPTYRLGTTHAILDGSVNAPILNQIFSGDSSGHAAARDVLNNESGVVFDPNGTMRVNLGSATVISINDFRVGAVIQQQLERDMRSGTRLPEIIAANFGVIAPDFRMQRPEFLGGGSMPIGVHQVAQTAPGATSFQGQLSAFGLGSTDGSGLGFTQSFTEHCVVLGIASVRTDYRYPQGLPREYGYSTRYDFFLPAFANLGEQVVMTSELYYLGLTANDNVIFGYNERWAEMRWRANRMTGIMRPQLTGSLGAVWTAAQVFGSAPLLDQDFIEENPPFDRVVAVPSEPHIIADFWFDYKCVRPLPMYSVPGISRV